MYMHCEIKMDDPTYRGEKEGGKRERERDRGTKSDSSWPSSTCNVHALRNQ